MKAEHDDKKSPNRTCYISVFLCNPVPSCKSYLWGKDFLSFTIDCNNCWWLVKIRGKKAGEDKSKCPEEMVEMSKVLISAQKPLGFVGAMTMEW